MEIAELVNDLEDKIDNDNDSSKRLLIHNNFLKPDVKTVQYRHLFKTLSYLRQFKMKAPEKLKVSQKWKENKIQLPWKLIEWTE